MAEFQHLLRKHPLVTGIIILCISPALIPLAILFSPFLLQILVAQHRRRICPGRQRFIQDRDADTSEVCRNEVITEKFVRLNAYLEQQMKFVLEMNAFMSSGKEGLCVVAEGKDKVYNMVNDLDTELVRSDVSDAGDESDVFSEDDSQDGVFL